ncbi:LLM class flavin-dependent oxidoreductase [Planococcus sp. ISL-109]|uniref:LLM class flavin-dependent oxidoreductase n=1 Tax=Planococcus sp. ISL-109 TaxID=2819166 RepID=UPI001BE8D1B8|nr:LLM class flavin-dependent oxidoreductase [Planococcus sp. ISL-109]MBT2583902.1 LLM class flavin-dependent oxidoreductase [Planococcus sp. ISL-109]
MTVLNILDYSPVDEGETAASALASTAELARLADSSGYHRYWVAEHHQVYSVAGSSPEMLMMHIATLTERIRIGSGGVMLPHYSAYKVAENFRLLEALHPNRIDLGVGRSPSFRLVNQALNESKGRVPYEQQLIDLEKYFTDDVDSEHRFQKLKVTPITGTAPELWLLGTGEGSAKLAAERGMAYAYAHFARPEKAGIEVVKHYREAFNPSRIRNHPHVSVAVFAIVGETEEQAEQLAKAFDLWLLFVESDFQPPYYPSVDTAHARRLSVSEQERVARNRSRLLVGTAEQVKQQIETVAEEFGADEITIIPNISGHIHRMNTVRLLADAFGMQ